VKYLFQFKLWHFKPGQLNAPKMLLQHEGQKYKRKTSGVTRKKISDGNAHSPTLCKHVAVPVTACLLKPDKQATIQPFFYCQQFTPTNNCASSRSGTTWKISALHRPVGPHCYCLVQMPSLSGSKLYLQMPNHSEFTPQNVNFRENVCSTGSWMILRT